MEIGITFKEDLFFLKSNLSQCFFNIRLLSLVNAAFGRAPVSTKNNQKLNRMTDKWFMKEILKVSLKTASAHPQE